MNSLNEQYIKEMVPKLKTSLKLDNVMSVPKLEKLVINASLGEAIGDKKVIERMAEQLGVITGQKAQVTKAKKAISTFKLREGDAIGLKVTLRGERMYDFLVKLISIALPRVRDFRGIPSAGFDGNGNYTLGISEQTIFPEIDFAMVDKVRGFQVTFVTNARTNEEAKALLIALGLPFEKHIVTPKEATHG